jgi:hypothetical protein
VHLKNQRLKLMAEHLGRQAKENGLTPEDLKAILDRDA